MNKPSKLAIIVALNQDLDNIWLFGLRTRLTF